MNHFSYLGVSEHSIYIIVQYTRFYPSLNNVSFIEYRRIYTRRGYGLLYDFNRIIAVTLIGLLGCGMFDRGIEYYEIISCVGVFSVLSWMYFIYIYYIMD